MKSNVSKLENLQHTLEQLKIEGFVAHLESGIWSVILPDRIGGGSGCLWRSEVLLEALVMMLESLDAECSGK
jgi:hypothetical protein